MQIDRLEVMIESQASSAVGEIDKLYNAMSSLSTAMSKSSDLSKGIGKIATAANRLAKVDKASLKGVTDAVRDLGNISVNTGSVSALNKLVNAMARLAKETSGLGTSAGNMQYFAVAIRDAINTIGGAGDPSQAVSNMVNALARLASAGGKIGQTVQELPALTREVSNFFNELARAPHISKNTADVVTAMANLAKSGKSASLTLSKFKKVSVDFSGAMNVVKSVVKGVVSIFKTMISVGTSAAKGIAKVAKGIVTSFVKIGNATLHLNKASNGFGKLLKSALPFFGAYKLFSFAKESTELASSLTEVQNVVDHAFGTEGSAKVEKFVQTSIDDFGLAELTAKQLSSRFQAMGVSMGITGQQVAKASSNVAKYIKSDLYDKTATSMAEMSLNLTRLAGDMASFYDQDVSDVATSLYSVFTGTTRPLRQYGIDLTQATLQEWALKQGIDADISSMTQAEKTLLRYQYVIANTSMIHEDAARTADTWANSIRRLKQHLQALGAAIGNIIVNFFLPFVKRLNVIVRSITAAVETIGNALGAIFGWEMKTTPAALLDDSYDGLAGDMEDSAGSVGDLSDNANDASKNLDKANDSAKELKRTILGFDEINKLNDANTGTTSPAGASSPGNTGNNGNIGLPGLNIDEDAIKAGTAVLEESGKDITKAFESAIDSLEKLGGWISQKLIGAMHGINWNDVYQSARDFGTGLADFLNGLITPQLFDALGTTIAGFLNTKLEALSAFAETFDWTNFGTSLGTGFRSFIEKYNWELTGKNFATFTNGVFDAISAAIAQINATELGTKVGNMVKTGLNGIKWKEKVFPALEGLATKLANFLKALFTKDTFTALGTTVSNLLYGALDFLNTFGKSGVFGQFGTALAAGLNALFNPNTFSMLAQTVLTTLNGALEFLNHFGDEFNWEGFAESLGKTLNDVLTNFNWPLAASTFANLVNKIALSMRIAMVAFDAELFGKRVATAVRIGLRKIKWKEEVFPTIKLFGTKLASYLNGLFNKDTFAELGRTVGNLISGALEFLVSFGSRSGDEEGFNWAGFGESLAAGLNGVLEGYTPADFSEAVTVIGKGIITALGSFLKTTSWFSVGKAIKESILGINWKVLLHGLGDVIWEAINAAIETAKGLFDGTPFEDAINSIEETVNRVAETLDFQGIADGLGKIFDAGAPFAEGFMKGLTDAFGALADIGVAVLNGIGVAFEILADALNKIPPEVAEQLGKDLGTIAVALGSIKLATAAITVIGGLVGKFTALKGLGNAATVVKNVATAAQGLERAAGTGAAAMEGLLTTFEKIGIEGGGAWAAHDIMKKIVSTLDGSAKASADADKGFLLIREALADVGTTIDDVNVYDVIKPMQHLAQELAPDFATAFGEVAKKFEDVGGDVDALKLKLAAMIDQGLFTDEQAKIIEAYIGDVDSLVKKNKELAQTVTDIANPAVDDFTENLEEINATVNDIVNPAYEDLGDTMESYAKTVDEIVNPATDSIKTNEEEVAKTLDNILNPSIDDTATNVEGLSKTLNEILDPAFTGTQTASEETNKKVGEFQTGLWGFLGGMFVQSLAAKFITGAFGDIGTATDDAGEKVTGFSGILTQLAKDAKDKSKEMTENFGDGTVDGFADEIDKTEKATIDYWEKGVGGPSTRTLQEQSPSKLSYGYATNFVQGFINGLGDSTVLKDLDKALTSLFDKVVNAFSDLKSKMETVGKDAIGGLKSGMESRSKEANLLSTIISNIKSKMNINLSAEGSSAMDSFISGMKNKSVPKPKYTINTWSNAGEWGYSWNFAWQYAKGGFPNNGELFLANEAGPEMIGRMGNRNVVANNKQITDGIKAAVVDGMMEVAMATGGLGGNNDSAPFVINATLRTENNEVLARAVQRGMARRNSRFNTVGAY